MKEQRLVLGRRECVLILNPLWKFDVLKMESGKEIIVEVEDNKPIKE
jgi:hypothetical protein